MIATSKPISGCGKSVENPVDKLWKTSPLWKTHPFVNRFPTAPCGKPRNSTKYFKAENLPLWKTC